MKNIAALFALLLVMTGCATTGSLSPQQAGATTTSLFKEQRSLLIWVPGTSNAVASVIAASSIGGVGLESPVVSEIHRAMAPGRDTDVRLAIAGPDSRFAASAAIAALNNTADMLPKLQLAFIGSRAHADKVRRAVEAKGGKFLYAAPAGS